MNGASAKGATLTLGYAGLIPFVLPAILVAVDSSHAAVARTIAGAYALAILCFLFGSWWGMAQRSGVAATLWLSNGLLLAALGVYLFAPDWWPLAAALLLVVAWLTEQNRQLFPDYPSAYRRLRAVLTGLAAASMLVIQLFP